MDVNAILNDLSSEGFEPELSKGRFEGEFLIKVLWEGSEVLKMLLFPGRSYYRGWVEVFSVSPRVKDRPFFGSDLERKVLDTLGRRTGKVFFEYIEDRETVRELSLGVPPALSRLGFELGKRGFTWFRDWYFPEGLREGNPKIQAEKPVSRDRLRRHLASLREDFEKFKRDSGDGDIKGRAEERFKILQELWLKSWPSAFSSSASA